MLDRAAIEAIAGSPEGIQLHRQPIVDLVRGRVTGFEVLARFDGHSPVEVFSAAEALGLSETLELGVIRDALGARGELPADTFLTINVSPDVMGTTAFLELIEGEALGGVVFEITERVPIRDYDGIRRSVATIRSRDGMLAVDDAGAGYASLRHVLSLRPQFVKVDRSLIDGLPEDPAKRAVVELLGRLTSQIDCWLLAEGIEREEELRELLAMGVPLGQGYALGRPGPGHPSIDPSAESLLASYGRIRGVDRDAVIHLLNRAPSATTLEGARSVVASYPERCTHVPVTDARGRPLGLIEQSAVERGDWAVFETLCVEPSASLSQVARRAAGRRLRERFAPVICRGPDGRYLGVIEVDRMLDALARREP